MELENLNLDRWPSKNSIEDLTDRNQANPNPPNLSQPGHEISVKKEIDHEIYERPLVLKEKKQSLLRISAGGKVIISLTDRKKSEPDPKIKKTSSKLKLTPPNNQGQKGKSDQKSPNI